MTGLLPPNTMEQPSERTAEDALSHRQSPAFVILVAKAGASAAEQPRQLGYEATAQN